MNKEPHLGNETPSLKKSERIGYLFFKRVFDLLFSIFMMVPLTILAVAIKLIFLVKKENGPLFYKQERVGKDGRLFNIIKFRTMTPDAEKELNFLLENENNKEEWEQYHKFENDPRITSIGLFLRKTSIDEFPQFVNVLKGEMSLVGPRPLVPGELELHRGLPIYNSVKPGITGWWACNGRSKLDYQRRLKLEYYYIENMSFILDLKILFKTVGSVFHRTGAR